MSNQSGLFAMTYVYAINYRLFLSVEPPPVLERPLPVSLLQNCIKVTNEPPEGLQVSAAILA